jgi:Plasmid pRiA4b ORF-3-like protein
MLELSTTCPGIYQFRVVLCGVSPLVWRQLLMASETTLAELHCALQIAFNWSDEHWHCFRIHGRKYGIPQWGGTMFHEDARHIPLSRFRLHCGERFRYEYDFTADWKLDIRLEKLLPFDPGQPIPLCTAGRRAAPTEDCCGARDYLERLDRRRYPFEELAVMAETVQRLLASDGDRRAIGDLDELREAVERVEAYQEFQPERFERHQVNRQLRAIQRRVQP